MAHKGPVNWRQIFFYTVEVIYALIVGLSEATIYQIYEPDSPLSVFWAGARATITQIILIMLAVAVVESYRSVGGGWRGFVKSLPLYLMLLPCSFLAYWFMREAAILAAHPVPVGVLNQHPLVLGPLVLMSQDMDVNLVAAVPFFQIIMTWIAPLVVRQHEPESAEMRQARQQAELEEAKHRREMEKVNGGRLGRAFRQNFEAITAKPQEEAEEAAKEPSEEEVERQIEAEITDEEMTPRQLSVYISKGARKASDKVSARTVQGWLYNPEHGGPKKREFLPARQVQRRSQAYWVIADRDVLALQQHTNPRMRRYGERYAAYKAKYGHLRVA